MTNKPLRTMVRSNRQPSMGGKDDGGRVDGDSGGEPALQEEEGRSEQTGLGIKAVPEKLVGGVDIQTPVHWQEYRGDDESGPAAFQNNFARSPAVLIALAGRGDESDGAGLGGHNRNADGGPLHVRVALQVVVRSWRPRVRHMP